MKEKKSSSPLFFYLVYSTFGFLLTSLLVFATVALGESFLYKNLGLAGAYLFWIFLFIATGGLVLYRLVKRFLSLVRFYCIYSAAFFLYSLAWILSYFWLRGTSGELLGSFGGSVLFSLFFAFYFHMVSRAWLWSTILFLSHTIGYFSGSYLNSFFKGEVGMMLWGIFYGIGFGIGLGFILYEVKEKEIGE